MKKVDDLLWRNGSLVRGVDRQPDAFSSEVPAIDVPCAERLDRIPVSGRNLGRLNYGTNTVLERLGQLSPSLLLLKTILEQSTVIPRKGNRFRVVRISPNAYTGFMKLQATFFNMQNLKNWPARIIDGPRDSIRHYRLAEPQDDKNECYNKRRPSSFAKRQASYFPTSWKQSNGGNSDSGHHEPDRKDG